MARKPRIHFPGALYHVMLRGNDGQKIFYNAKDRETFNGLIEDGARRYGHSIYAFCWMSNHIHLAVEVNNIPLSKVIQNLSFRYTRYINKRLNRIGHLFQGRYKAILVQKDSYLLELIRYIHLNPIRAKIVDKIEDYVWSSHRCYLGVEKISWVETQEVLSRFSKKEATARQDYLHFLMEGIEQKGMDFKKGGKDDRVFGNAEFIEKIKFEESADEPALPIKLIIEITCQLLAISTRALSGKNRKQEINFAKQVIGYINKHYGEITNYELATMFSLDPSTLSKTTTNIEENQDERVKERINEIIFACKKAIN